MSTRGAYGFRLNNKDYISYNHSDSYPEGLGESILKQTKELLREGIKKLKNKVSKIKLVTDKIPPTKEDIKNLKRYTNLGVGTQSNKDWYCLTRELQGSLIANIISGYMMDSSEFLFDSSYCEYAYILNLDDEILEIYGGSVTEMGDGRYASKKSNPDDEFYGVKLIWTIPLDSLPRDLGVLSITQT